MQQVVENTGSNETKKRNRISLSCNYCKRRKVKCDRGKPCSSCVKYNVAGLCEYPSLIINPAHRPSSQAMYQSVIRPTFSVNDGSTNGESGGKSDTVESELQFLKQKLRDLESSISQKSNTTTATGPPTKGNGAPVGIGEDSLFEFGKESQPSEPTPTNSLSISPPESWSIPSTNAPPLLEVIVAIRKKYRLVNPYRESNEKIDFYNNMDNKLLRDAKRRLHFGVFSWLNLIGKDRPLKLIWLYLHLKAARKTVYELVMTSMMKPLDKPNNTEEEFRTRASLAEFARDPIAPEKPDTVGLQIFGALANDAFICNQVPLSQSKPFNRETPLFEKILVTLPKKKVTWLLINRFFADVYPYMPFFDEVDFKSEIARIIGPEEYTEGQIAKLNIATNIDFAHLGVLLTMLRFAYMSLICNLPEVNEFNITNTSKTPEAEEIRYLLNNAIPSTTVEVAQECLNQFDVLRNCEVAIIQLMFFLRIYHMFGPEEGDCADGRSSQVINGMMVQIAYSMGLNREPGSFTESKEEEKQNSLLRKLWFFMVISDLVQGYQYGNPRAVDKRCFDMRLPFYKKGIENILDTEMEKSVIASFGYFENYYPKLTAILDLALNMQSKPRVVELNSLITDFEQFLFHNFGSIEDYMVPFQKDLFQYPFIKTMKLKNYLNMSGFLISLFVHLNFHFDEKGDVDLATHYNKKLIVILTVTLLPYYYDLISFNALYMGRGSDLILSPTIILMMHKANQANLALQAKVNATIFSMKKNRTHESNMKDLGYRQKFQKYCRLSKSIQKTMKYTVASLSKLANRYYYAWRITKAHNFLINIINGNLIFEDSDFYDVVEKFSKVRLEDIDELTSLFDTALNHLNQRRSDFCGGTSNCTGESSLYRDDAHNGYSLYKPNRLEADYTPGSNDSDNAYYEMVNNKEVDEIWRQFTEEAINGSNIGTQDGPVSTIVNKSDFNDIFNAVENYILDINY